MLNVRRLLVVGRAVLPCCAALSAVCACNDDSLRRVQRAGELRVGYAVEAPYAMVSEQGTVTGQCPESVRQIAPRMGIDHLEWVQSSFSALIPDLLDRRFDLIAAGMFVTAERARKVRFARPTLRVTAGLLVRRGNPRALPSFEALQPLAGRRIAVLVGSVEQSRLSQRGFSVENLLPVPDAQAGKAAVAHGAADAFALSLPTVRWMARAAPEEFDALAAEPGPQLERRCESSASSCDSVAMAFHPDDAALARAWDESERNYIGSSEHLATLARFGFRPEEAARNADAMSSGAD